MYLLNCNTASERIPNLRHNLNEYVLYRGIPRKCWEICPRRRRQSQVKVGLRDESDLFSCMPRDLVQSRGTKVNHNVPLIPGFHQIRGDCSLRRGYAHSFRALRSINKVHEGQTSRQGLHAWISELLGYKNSCRVTP